MTVHAEDLARPRQRDMSRAAAGTRVLDAALALTVVPLMGELAGTDGKTVAEALTESAGRLQLVVMLAVLASAALILAAVRLGRSIGGVAGQVAAQGSVTSGVCHGLTLG